MHIYDHKNKPRISRIERMGIHLEDVHIRTIRKIRGMFNKDLSFTLFVQERELGAIKSTLGHGLALLIVTNQA